MASLPAPLSQLSCLSVPSATGESQHVCGCSALSLLARCHRCPWFRTVKTSFMHITPDPGLLQISYIQFFIFLLFLKDEWASHPCLPFVFSMYSVESWKAQRKVGQEDTHKVGQDWVEGHVWLQKWQSSAINVLPDFNTTRGFFYSGLCEKISDANTPSTTTLRLICLSSFVIAQSENAWWSPYYLKLLYQSKVF